MTKHNKKRLVFYPCVFVIAAVLLYLSLFYKVDASTATLVNAAKLYAHLGMYDQALENCNEVLEKEPKNVGAFLVTGFVHELQGEFTKAINVYEKAEVLCAQKNRELQKDILLAIADRHRQIGNYKNAMAMCQRLKREFPRDCKAFLIEGLVHADQGNYQSALDAFCRASDDEEKELFTLYYSGKAHLSLSQEREALEKFKKIAAKDPKALDVWYQIAKVHTQLGEKEEAQQAMEEALRQNPKLKDKVNLTGQDGEESANAPLVQEQD